MLCGAASKNIFVGPHQPDKLEFIAYTGVIFNDGTIGRLSILQVLGIFNKRKILLQH